MRLLALLCIAVALSACTSTRIPQDALLWTQESMETRQLQTRHFETKDEKALLVAAAGLMQDMGYAIDESEVPLGLIVGSKDRDATETGQVVGAVVMSALFGTDPLYDDVQKIRASLVTRPSDLLEGNTLLRVTFQRRVWNNKGVLWKLEAIEDPAVYGEFFEKLSKAVFLEAHEI